MAFRRCLIENNYLVYDKGPRFRCKWNFTASSSSIPKGNILNIVRQIEQHMDGRKVASNGELDPWPWMAKSLLHTCGYWADKSFNSQARDLAKMYRRFQFSLANSLLREFAPNK